MPSSKIGWRRLKGTEAACVFGSGYLANTGIIPALVGADDLIVLDELSHACIHAGAKLSGAEIHLYRHGDATHAEAILAKRRSAKKRALLATDGVFSMDGDLAPLGELSQIAKRFDAWLLSDDAHGLGVLGGGRGSAFANGGAQMPHRVAHEVPLQMGTLSKAVGAYGGYLCASRTVVDLMRTRARTFIYSTGLPPPVVAAAIAALDVIETDPAYAAEPLRKARLFTRALNLPEAESAIVPVIVGETEAALSASELLRDGRLPRRCDPAADGARRHGAAAFCLHGATSGCRNRAACGYRAAPGDKALARDRDLHHRDRNRRRQDLRRRLPDPAFAVDGPGRGCVKTGGRAASTRQCPRRAILELS